MKRFPQQKKRREGMEKSPKEEASNSVKKRRKTSKERAADFKNVLKAWQLYILLLPALIWAVVFAYYPMYGLIIAFPIPIIFALLLNQIQRDKVKKTIQTISYAPYFMSNVVIVSIITVFFSANGVVNNLIKSAGGKETLFTSLPEWFRTLFIGSNIWQTMGFNAVIFIAALTAISPDFYEAAKIDGASRFQRILFIDIPMILPTIILMLILQVGNIMNVGYEKAFLMQNGSNTIVSELISTYVYKVGLQTAQYSFATAVGLFNSVVNFIILVLANKIAKKVSSISIF